MERLKKIAIACQGGGSHCAFTGGVLAELLPRVQCDPQEGRLILDQRYEIVALSGTSGGAISAYLAWVDLLRLRQGEHIRSGEPAVQRFWRDTEAHWMGMPPYDLMSNLMMVGLSQMEGLVPLLSPTPNLLTRRVQLELARSIRHAAGDLGFLGADAREGCVAREQVENLPYGKDHFPVLLIGAADLDRGEFSPFVATPRHPPLVEQIVASTALPDIFPAVTLSAPGNVPAPGARQDSSADAGRSAHYWDGLFSQNPPIGDLLGFKELAARPDEIWIVRINPAKRHISRYALGDGPPVTASEIHDRRNELAGNLSLEQEKRFVRKINSMLRKKHLCSQGEPAAAAGEACYKTVALWGLALEGEADVPESDAHPEGGWRKVDLKTQRKFTRALTHSSKLLREPYFLRELQQLGREALVEFLDFRRRHAGEPEQAICTDAIPSDEVEQR